MTKQKILKMFGIITVALTLLVLIPYLELIAGLTFEMVFIPNLFIGGVFGMYIFYLLINTLKG